MVFVFLVSFILIEVGEFFVEVMLIINDFNVIVFNLVLKGIGIEFIVILEIIQDENLFEIGYIVDFGNVEVGMEFVE